MRDTLALPSPGRVPRVRPFSAIRAYLARESVGGVVLIGVAALALVVANSPLAPDYFALRDRNLGGLTLLHWINDGAMALFFLLVGLEVKRELIDGELATWERRRLPGLAAAAGMAVPALIYVAFNRGDDSALRGWAIPTATDIAFALGIAALLGRRVPASLKLFLTTVAILDDLGAVAIIALVYSDGVDVAALGVAGALLAALALVGRAGVTRLWPFVLAAPLIWYAVLVSGLHATLAGVALAAVVPLRATPGRIDDRAAPLIRLEHALSPLVAFAVVPLFGFWNAGVAFGGLSLAAAGSGVPLGIAFGLFFGKQAGVLGAVWLAVRMGWAHLPAKASWRQTYGVALLCGIGFTMSLFIGGLAFDGDPVDDDLVKLGVIAGSLASAVAGVAVLATAPRVPGGDRPSRGLARARRLGGGPSGRWGPRRGPAPRAV